MTADIVNLNVPQPPKPSPEQEMVKKLLTQALGEVAIMLGQLPGGQLRFISSTPDILLALRMIEKCKLGIRGTAMPDDGPAPAS